MVGAPAVPPTGAAQLGAAPGAPHFVAGYCGMSAPVKLRVCTFSALFEKAVPTVIAGVRP